MRRDVQARLAALEQRHQPGVPAGLGEFYGLPRAQRERLTAHLYGTEQRHSSEGGTYAQQ